MYSNIYFSTLQNLLELKVQDKNHTSDIKLYKIELSKFESSTPYMVNILSDSEKNRADKFHFSKDKNRFVICRTILKFLLAEHTKMAIDKIIISEDANKKPYLASHPSVFFNVSHSENYALIAISKNPVGVDVEYIRKDFNYQEITSTVFNEAEINEIANSSNKHLTFYKFWTRKEAIVKTTGKGLDDNLVKITVTDGLHSVPSHLISDLTNINIYSFNVASEYIGALAITENNDNLTKIQFLPLPDLEKLKHFK